MDIDCLTDCKNVPVAALTANAVAGMKEMFLQNGFDDFLPKPIDIAGLNALIEKWIPAEKQKKIVTAEEAELKNRVAQNELINIGIPGIDVKKGIFMTGGKIERYLCILKTYHEDGYELLEEISICMEMDDMDLYKIHVHALKSASVSIGAAGISKMAEALEQAAERGDIDLVRAMNPKFTKDLEILLDNIYSVIGERSNEANVTGQKYPQPKAEIKGAAAVRTDRQMILLIDDMPSILHILNSILTEDYDIIVEKSGDAGLLTAKKHMPDLILLDVVMPGMSGYEVLEAIKDDEMTKHIPVILITGNDSGEDETEGYALGATDYVKKPFAPAAVKHKVNFNIQFILMKQELEQLKKK
jgi:CheY-like chemotaxis protein/HPt (histidine-containing phosphotransfer) domain-containing protein